MATTPYAITYLKPGAKTTISNVFSSDDTTVTNNWGNILSAGQLLDGTAVAYAKYWVPAVLGNNNTVFLGGMQSGSTYGGVPNSATLIVDKTSSIALANGANNNLAGIGLSNFARIVGPTGSFNITGIASGADGVTLTLWNSTSQTMTISNNSGSSSAGNKILTGTGADIALPGSGAVDLTFSGTDNAWLVTGLSEVTSGTGTVTSVGVSGGTTGLTTSGGPVTTTGTITLAGALAVANGGTAGTTIPTAQVGLGIQQAVVASDVTNATTSLASITGLAFALAATGTYYFRACLFGTSPDANGIKLGITLPAGATMLVSANGNTSGVTAYSTDRISASATAGIAYLGYNGTGQIFVEGTVVSGGAGNVQLTFLKATSGTGTISAKSNIIAMQVA